MQRITALATVLLVSCMSHKVLATTINFDTAPDGSSIAYGTDLTNVYTSLGVTFSVLPCDLGVGCFPGVGTTPVAVGTFFAASPPNVISIDTPSGRKNDGFNELLGIVQATFASPQSSVSIQVFSQSLACCTNVDAPYLKAFNSSGTLLATATTPSNISQEYTLTDIAAGISFVEFSAGYSYLYGDQAIQYGSFDNLTFPAQGVPEPGTAALLVLGFSGVAIARKKLKAAC